MRITISISIAILAVASALHVSAAESLTMNLELTPGASRNPMIVAWLVDNDNRFVRTLYIFTKHKKYFKYLNAWTKSPGRQESAQDVDAVLGPTIKWKETGSATIPVRIGDVDLLSGNYTIRIEQNKEKGEHYTTTRIPLTKDYAGGTLNDQGFIKTLTLTVK